MLGLLEMLRALWRFIRSYFLSLPEPSARKVRFLTKAALNMLGLPGGYTRLPLVDATEDQITQLRKDLIAGGVAV